MGRRACILTEILGFDGFRVMDAYFETPEGSRVVPVAGFAMLRGTRLVLVVARRWAARCSGCGGRCARVHERGRARRWLDLPWGEHAVFIEYAPVRVRCTGCRATPVEMVAWAEVRQQQTRRLQQQIAIDAASAPLSRVAEKYGMSWGAAHRAEHAGIERWQRTRPEVPMIRLGIDEKWLGRRHRLEHKFVTIVSNLDTGEPIWMGYGRSKEVLAGFLAGLETEQRAGLELVAVDMYGPFLAALREAEGLKHVAIVHDPFHVLKRVGEAIDDARREVFFRAGSELRAAGRGTRWLFLRAWDRTTDGQRERLRAVLSRNGKLARAYELKEQIRDLVLHAPDGHALADGLKTILRRLRRSSLEPLRKLAAALDERLPELMLLADYRPATGRIEALNNNWETLVRRGRGYRNHDGIVLKLRFMIANPLRSLDGLRAFAALGQAA